MRSISKGSLMKIRDGDIVSVFTFQFNPTERAVTRAPMFTVKSPPGSWEPDAFFGYVGGSTFSIKLLLDATSGYSELEQGVRARKAWLEQFTYPDYDKYVDELGGFTSPAYLRYSMGGRSFYVRLINYTARDVMFNSQGIEIRSWIDLDFQTVFKDRANEKSTLAWLNKMAALVEVYQ
jgi:hypothetical protein